MKVIEAIFEKGVFRPVSPVVLAEGLRVEVLVPAPPVEPVTPPGDSGRRSFGTLPHEDAEEIARIVAEEFEQVDARG